MSSENALSTRLPTWEISRVKFYHKVLEVDGNEEYGKAISRCFVEGEGNKKVTDPFTTLFENNFLFSDRV